MKQLLKKEVVPSIEKAFVSLFWWDSILSFECARVYSIYLRFNIYLNNDNGSIVSYEILTMYGCFMELSSDALFLDGCRFA